MYCNDNKSTTTTELCLFLGGKTALEWCSYNDNRFRKLFNGAERCEFEIDNRTILFDHGELGCYEPISACDKALFIWCT